MYKIYRLTKAVRNIHGDILDSDVSYVKNLNYDGHIPLLKPMKHKRLQNGNLTRDYEVMRLFNIDGSTDKKFLIIESLLVSGTDKDVTAKLKSRLAPDHVTDQYTEGLISVEDIIILTMKEIADSADPKEYTTQLDIHKPLNMVEPTEYIISLDLYEPLSDDLIDQIKRGLPA